MALLSPPAAAELAGRPGTVLLDVRTAVEYEAARLADARLADWYRPDFRSLIDDLDRDAPTLVYCRTGRRSADAVRLMESLGFSDVHDLAGGIVAWFEEGLAVEQ